MSGNNFRLTIHYRTKGSYSELTYKTLLSAEAADDALREEVNDKAENEDVVVKDDFSKRVAFKVRDFLRTELEEHSW